MLPWSCCLGFLIFTFLFLLQSLTQSGINLSLAQSPPPITFPALADAKDHIFIKLKETYDNNY